MQCLCRHDNCGCTVTFENGQKKYKLYETSQIMRRIECEIRREKDTAVAAQAAGDERLRVDCQLRNNHLSGLYKQVTDASGLTPRRERMTVEGFRRAKVPENAEKGLTSDAESGKINKKIHFYNIHEQSENGLFTEEEIESAMKSSPIGKNASQYFTDAGLSLEMNYDLNAPEAELGRIIGKNITIFVANHSDALEVSQTLVHEIAHYQFKWNETQEDEINCMIYDYLHRHETISDNMIAEIVRGVKVEYSDLPEGDLYGY